MQYRYTIMSLLKPVSEGIYVLFCMVWCLNTVMRASNRFLVDLTWSAPHQAPSCLGSPHVAVSLSLFLSGGTTLFWGTNDDIFQTLMLCIE